MPLMKRSRAVHQGVSEQSDVNNDDKSRPNRIQRSQVMAFIACILFFACVVMLGEKIPLFVDGTTYNNNNNDETKQRTQIYPNIEIMWGIQPAITTDGVSKGPHKVTITISTQNKCPNPGLWMRLEGDALVGINLMQQQDTNLKSKLSWNGQFSIPLPGNYQMVAHWYGCSSSEPKKVVKIADLVVKDIFSNNKDDNGLYPSSAWISSKKFPSTEPINQPYVWMATNISISSAELFRPGGETVIAKQGTYDVNNGLYDFEKLSNYELVCWVGSDSALQSRDSFLKIRGLISGQRPFKFHHYPSNSFSTPDEEWPLEMKKKFRKCKHILLSFDEMKEKLTQKAYQIEIDTFVHHLLKAFPDDTFPIWIFTVAEPPMHASNCIEPHHLPKSSDHPCNDALQDLFAQNKFPTNRVHLLDNSDITLPLLGENKKDAIAVMAFRIYVFVGKKVREWRKAGQKGTVQGLERGGKLEPNFELVPYEGWS